MKQRSFRVTLRVPPAATIRECQDYIQEAVATWWGQCRPPGAYSDDDPGDPMFDLDDTTITVTRIRSDGR